MVKVWKKRKDGVFQRYNVKAKTLKKNHVKKRVKVKNRIRTVWEKEEKVVIPVIEEKEELEEYFITIDYDAERDGKGSHNFNMELKIVAQKGNEGMNEVVSRLDRMLGGRHMDVKEGNFEGVPEIDPYIARAVRILRDKGHLKIGTSEAPSGAKKGDMEVGRGTQKRLISFFEEGWK